MSQSIWTPDPEMLFRPDRAFELAGAILNRPQDEIDQFYVCLYKFDDVKCIILQNPDNFNPERSHSILPEFHVYISYECSGDMFFTLCNPKPGKTREYINKMRIRLGGKSGAPERPGGINRSYNGRTVTEALVDIQNRFQKADEGNRLRWAFLEGMTHPATGPGMPVIHPDTP